MDVDRYRTVLPVKQKRVYSEAKNNKNDLEFVFSGLFLAYKTFFSSQDGSACSFHPSCSEYGILAMKQNGLILGGIQTMDRLTRCNGLSPEKYQIDPKNRLLFDYPEARNRSNP